MGDKQKDENNHSKRNCSCKKAHCVGGRSPELTKAKIQLLQDQKLTPAQVYIAELESIIKTREEQIKVINACRDACLLKKNMHEEKGDVRDKCEDRALAVAEISKMEGELDIAEGDEAKTLLYIRNICLSGKVPQLKYDCVPQPLPKLPDPVPGENLGSLPKPLNIKDLPPIIWDHGGICREIVNPSRPLPDSDVLLSGKVRADIENLRKACGLIKADLYKTICQRQAPQQSQIKNETTKKVNKSSTDLDYKKTSEENAEEDNKKLLALLETLEAEVATAKADTQAGRRRIIELCIRLKEKEAAIRECSQLLCRIIEDQDSGDAVLIHWLNMKLSRYVEYLRWLLIRLNYEKKAQEAEIKSLMASLAQQDMTLRECLATKKRICDEKTSQLQEFSAYGVCNISI